MTTFSTAEAFEADYKTLHATYQTGVTKAVQWRKWQLKQLYWLIHDNETVLADAIIQDLHRHPFEAIAFDLVGIKQEVLYNLSRCEQWAQGERPAEPGFVMGRLGQAWLRKEPLGVALIIGTWNFPLFTLLAPMIPAIAAGNCVMLKPSELATACQKIVVDLIPKYLDQSAIRVCTGGPKETSFILEHKFNHIFYTGGSKVGRIIATAAAKHLTPIVLELGGQAPAIVAKTADIDLSAKRIAHAKLVNAGQVCLNVNHIFADPEIYDELVERITFWMKDFLRNGTDHIAHIISNAHFSRVTGLLDKTVGRIVYTGKNDPATNFVHPTIIADVKPTDSLMSEELFCPYVPIIKADVQTAVDTVNSMPHPLGLYIFSKDKKEIDFILNHTTSGGVTINDVMIHAGVPSSPFGGVGESGHGSYHGKYGFEAFSHTRTVVTMPSYFEMVLSWRYAPFKMENRKYIEGQMPKVNFKRGEGIEDQRLGQGKGLIGRVGLLAAVLAAVTLSDHLSGQRLGFNRYLGNVVNRLSS